MITKRATSTLRVTVNSRRLLKAIARQRGISQTAVVEQLARDYAEQQGILIPVHSNNGHGKVRANFIGIQLPTQAEIDADEREYQAWWHSLTPAKQQEYTAHIQAGIADMNAGHRIPADEVYAKVRTYIEAAGAM